MVKKRVYRAINVNRVVLQTLEKNAKQRGTQGVVAGLDVAKNEIVVAIRWKDGAIEAPWKVNNPDQIPMLIECLEVLRDDDGKLCVAMESTGTYGDVARRLLTLADMQVVRVKGKAVADYKEIYDGVGSQHDGKDAAIIAELASMGKSTPWPYQQPDEDDEQMRCDVARHRAYKKRETASCNRLEALLARHWPEVTETLPLTSKTLIDLLAHYAGPAALTADTAAAERLRKWSRGSLKPHRIEEVLHCAANTMGLPMSAAVGRWIQEIAQEVIACRKELAMVQKRLEQHAKSRESMRPYIRSVGAPTLCTIWSTVGDPAQYDSAGAFIKAFGLNLTELSSGKHRGRLRTSKRGPGEARRILFMWAMRAVQRPSLAEWFKRFKQVGNAGSGKVEHRAMKGLVAIMRRLAAGLWHARRHGERFNYRKLFPGAPLRTRSHQNNPTPSCT